jgi:hypothetical protein
MIRKLTSLLGQQQQQQRHHGAFKGDGQQRRRAIAWQEKATRESILAAPPE